MIRKSIKLIQNKKNKKKITCLTAYTASIAKIIDKYVDIILIGDSVGMAIYGMKNTQGVTLDIMKLHGKTVNKFSNKAFNIIDMPYGTYENKKAALKNAKELLDYTKCQSVKLETHKKDIEIVKHLVKNNIIVVSHIGVTPQKYKNFKKIKSVGKTTKEHDEIYNLAIELEYAGSSLIVLECMKTNLAKKITENISIPTIGIGASAFCDGQILVINDILNTNNSLNKPRFVKSYADLDITINKSVKQFCSEVINNKFPRKKNSYD